MKSPTLGIATAIALALSTGVVLAGFGGDPNASKNQVPAPSVNNAADPQAVDPGSAAQDPTAPQKRDDTMNDSGTSGASSGEAGKNTLAKPQSSNPSP